MRRDPTAAAMPPWGLVEWPARPGGYQTSSSRFPYEMFELVCLDVEDGNEAYLNWIGTSVAPLAPDS